MSKMWKGPGADYLLALTDPVAVRLHRRAGEQSIAYDLAHDGRSAEVFRLERHSSGWQRVPLGRAAGDDAIHTCVNAALEYTEHDAELYALIARDIERRTAEIDSRFHEFTRKLGGALDAFAGAVAMLRLRYV